MTAEKPTITEPPRGRGFSLSDLMISIGGIGLLLAYGRAEVATLLQQFLGLHAASDAYFRFIYSGRPPFWTTNVANPWSSFAPSEQPRQMRKSMANYWSGVVWHGVQLSELVLLIMTAVFLMMRLGRPRPSIRELLGQPGTMSSLAVAVGLLLVNGWFHLLFFGHHPRLVTPVAIGGTVALAWVGMKLSRKWEAERSWIDRMGRVIGFMAIAVGLVSFLKFGI